MAERYERLSTNYDKYCAEGAPALIVAQALLKDTKSDKIVAQLKFQNIASKYIQAVSIELRAFDSFGKELQGLPEYQYTDLRVKIGEFWGTDKAIILPNNLTRTISISIKSIIFTDNTVWESNQSECYKLKTPDMLFLALKSEELVKQFQLEYGSRAENLYLEDSGVWHCVCGTINPNGSNECFKCKASREKLSSYDFELLKENADKRVAAEKAQAEERARLAKEKAEREAQEKSKAEAERIEKERLAKEKKQRIIKRICTCLFWIVDIAVIIGGIIYLIMQVLIPFIKYSNASKLQTAASYMEAIEIYEELGDYSDSSEKILQCKYSYASALKDENDYLAAREVYMELGDYSDSQERMKECIYHEALNFAEQGQYEQAFNMFSSIMDYSDASEQINKMKYGRVWEARDNGNYEHAISLLEEMPGEEKLIEEYKVLWGKQLIDTEQYADAIKILDTLNNDSEIRQLKNEAKYLYAKQCFEQGNYTEAKTLFDVTRHVYPDAEEWYNKSVYECANDYFQKGDYENATVNYGKIKKYKDSEEKYKESNYLWVSQLIKEKQYTDALNRLSIIPSYKDSKDKIKEVKYAYVTSHKDSTNTNTYRYLKDLVKIGYKDTSEIYDDLYEWKVTNIYFNTSESSTIEKSAISKFDPVYCHFKLEGGPWDEKIYVYRTVKFPDGSSLGKKKTPCEYGNGDTGWWGWSDGIYTNPTYGKTGTLTMNFYDENGNKIGSASVEITN